MVAPELGEAYLTEFPFQSLITLELHRLILFVAWQRDTLDSEGVRYPVVISMFPREVVKEPSLQFSEMRL